MTNRTALFISILSSCPRRHAGRALQFAPADQRTLQRAKDRLPNAVAEHWPVNQTHGKNAPCAQNRLSLENAGQRRENDIHGEERDDKRHDRSPGAEWKSGEQEQIDHWCDRDEDDLKKPNAWQTEPAERAIVPVEHHVAMFPEALQRAVGPAKTLSRQRAHALRRFRPSDRARHVDDSLPMFVQRKSQIGVFSERLQTEAARLIDRILANGADRTRHDRDAIPAIVCAPIKIEAASVFQRLTTRDERAQVPDL